MLFFALSHDLQQSLFSDWLNFIDFSQFDIALCNHALRPIFFSSLAQTKLYLPGTVSLYTEHGSSYQTDFFEEYPRVQFSEGFKAWMIKRSCNPRTILIDSEWKMLTPLQCQQFFAIQRSFILPREVVFNASKLLELSSDYRTLIADNSISNLCNLRAAAIVINEPFEADVFSPLAAICRSLPNLTLVHLQNPGINDRKYFCKLLQVDFGPYLRGLRFDNASFNFDHLGDSELDLKNHLPIQPWVANLEYFCAETLVVALMVLHCPSLRRAIALNSTDRDNVDILFQRLQNRKQPLKSLDIRAEKNMRLPELMLWSCTESLKFTVNFCTMFDEFENAPGEYLQGVIQRQQTSIRHVLQKLTIKTHLIDENYIDITVHKLTYLRRLYPDLKELTLSKFKFVDPDYVFSALHLPFRNLHRLEIIASVHDDNSLFPTVVRVNIVNDLGTYFQQLRVLRWDGLYVDDQDLELLLRGLIHLSWLSLTYQHLEDEELPGDMTKIALHHIATIRPNIRHLQLQIWNDLDIESLVHMLTACTQLSSFEVFGKLDNSDSAGKLALDALKFMMKEKGVACPFKVLPKFQPEVPPPLIFESY